MEKEIHPLTDKLDSDVRRGDSLSAYFMMRTHAQAMEKEAAQNWRFFELAAKEKERLLTEADAWKAMAIEMSYYVKAGWDDSDAALKTMPLGKESQKFNLYFQKLCVLRRNASRNIEFPCRVCWEI